MRSIIRKRSNYIGYRPRWVAGVGVVAAGVGAVGVILLQSSSAATFTAGSETETGLLAGNASKQLSVTDASNAQTVIFGGPINQGPLSAPANVKAFSGGNSIAVRWDSSLPGNAGIKEYEVYRDGTKIGTDTPSSKSDYPEIDGNGYIDRTANVGQTHTYQVVAVASDGRRSTQGSAAQVSSRAAGLTFVPTISVDASAASDLSGYLTNSVKPFLEVWYPKVSEALTRPAAGTTAPLYTPSTSLNVVVAPTGTNTIVINGNTLTVDAAYARANPNDMGIWAVVGGRVALAVPSAKDVDYNWEQLSLSHFVRDSLLHDRTLAAPGPNETYVIGRASGSQFMNWIQDNAMSNKDLAYQLNSDIKSGMTVGDSFVKRTDKTLPQLWTAMTGRSVATAGAYRTNNDTQCLDVLGGSLVKGTKAVNWNCAYNFTEVWTRYNLNNSNKFNLTMNGSCLDVTNNGETDGTPVQITDCTGSLGQIWQWSGSNSLLNPNSGKCLQTAGAVTTNNTTLEISTCTASAMQTWNPPAGLTTPSGIKAYTGGNDLAVRWDAQTTNPTISRYEVYRNNNLVATTSRNISVGGQRFGTLYVDKDVSRGTTYSYQVKAVDQHGQRSALSATISATHPTSTTAVPAVTIDPSVDQVDPELKTWLQNVGIPAIQTWYPKAGDKLARPDYTPLTAFTIKTQPLADYDRDHPDTAAVASGSLITMHPGYYKTNPEYTTGTMVHESTHLLVARANANAARWFSEGIANYVSYYMLNTVPRANNQPITPGSTENFAFDPYYSGSWLLDYINRNVDSTYLHRMTVAAKNGVVDSSFVQFSNGRDINQLWAEARGTTSRTGTIHNGSSSGKCVDVNGGSMAEGTKIQLLGCSSGAIKQKASVMPLADGLTGLMMLGKCLEVANGVTASGTAVWLSDCKKENANYWTVRADGSLASSVATNMCLQPAGGSTSDNTGLQIAVCNGSTSQRWVLP